MQRNEVWRFLGIFYQLVQARKCLGIAKTAKKHPAKDFRIFRYVKLKATNLGGAAKLEFQDPLDKCLTSLEKDSGFLNLLSEPRKST